MKRRTEWIILIGLIVSLLAGWLFLRWRLARNVASLVESKHRLLALERREESLNQLHQDFQLIKKDKQLVDRALPDKEGMVSFIARLEKEASASGGRAKVSFSPEGVKSESGAKKVNFSVNFKGTYHQLVNFIRRMERLPQVIVVDRISIRSPAGLEQAGAAVVTMKCFVDPNF